MRIYKKGQLYYMGRIREGKHRYEVRIPPELNDKLEEYADELCVSVSTYIQILVKKHLKEREEQKQNE